MLGKVDLTPTRRYQTTTMDNPDEFILHATEEAWFEKQLKDAHRAKQWELDHHKTYEELAAMNDEEYLASRWYDLDDKKGVHHLRNMVASAMQSAKSLSGTSFEQAIMNLAEDHDVGIVGQVHINENGDIKTKKSRHRIDGYVSATENPTNLKDCYVLSKKTTLRERWNQDIWCAPLCKGLVFLTRETPNSSTIGSIKEHKAIVVYPNAPVTANTWSYAEFLRAMKDFQK